MICEAEAPSLPRSVIGYCVPGSAAVVFVKGVAALRAELGRVSGVCRFPAALVALILGGTSRLGFAALGAELALVHRAAVGAGPAFSLGLGLAALHAELAGVHRAALALPAVGSGRRRGRLLNGLLGGFDVGMLVVTVAFAVCLLYGVRYMNYVTGVWLAAVAIYYLPGNLKGLSNGTLLYLLEGVVDLFFAFLLLWHRGVRQRFTMRH